MGDTQGNQYRRLPSLSPSSIIASPSCMSQPCFIITYDLILVYVNHKEKETDSSYKKFSYLTSSNVSRASMARPELQDNRLSTSSTVTNP